jgi:hypothetical protein
MKKLIFFALCLLFPLVVSCQAVRTLNYGLNMPILQLNGTTVSATAAQLNYSNTLTGNIQTQLNGKQATLVSGSNIKTVGGVSLLGSGDVSVAGLGSVTNLTATNSNGITWVITNPTSTPNISASLGAITPTSVNGIPFTGSSTPSLSVAGASSISGSNTGDNAVNTRYSGLVTNATHTGDATGATALTVVGIHNVLLGSLATGILKNTVTTGIPSIAVAGVDYLAPNGSAAALTNFPTLNQSTSGNSATATKLAVARTINGVGFDGTTNITIPSNITATVDGYVMTVASGLWTAAAPASVTVSARVDSIVRVLKDTIPLANMAVLKHAAFNVQTASYTLLLADDGGTVVMNIATANTLTVPPNSSVAFPIGTIINIECYGAGKTTVVAGGGVTIVSKGSHLGITILGDASLHKSGTDTWKLIGSLE